LRQSVQRLARNGWYCRGYGDFHGSGHDVQIPANVFYAVNPCFTEYADLDISGLPARSAGIVGFQPLTASLCSFWAVLFALLMITAIIRGGEKK
jgi:hypothetical protein